MPISLDNLSAKRDLIVKQRDEYLVEVHAMTGAIVLLDEMIADETVAVKRAAEVAAMEKAASANFVYPSEAEAVAAMCDARGPFDEDDAPGGFVT